jgi:hypothetical protein
MFSLGACSPALPKIRGIIFLIKKIEFFVRLFLSFGNEKNCLDTEGQPSLRIRKKVRIRIRIPDLNPILNPGFGSRSETEPDFFFLY